MKVFLAVMLVAIAARTAAANDSEWLVCEGVAKGDSSHHAMYLAASVLEHRGSDGASRAADIALMHGANIAIGSYTTDNGKPGKVTLLKDDKAAAKVFDGTSTLDLNGDKHAFSLKGKLDVMFGNTSSQGGADWMPIEVAFTCKVLDDLAIGH